MFARHRQTNVHEREPRRARASRRPHGDRCFSLPPRGDAMTARLSRRGLLGAGAAFAASSLLPRGVGANPTAPPRRLVVFYSPNGTVYNQWVPQGTETSWTLSPILKPLAPFQQKVVVVDNLNNQAGHDTPPGDCHAAGMGTHLTGIQLPTMAAFAA